MLYAKSPDTESHLGLVTSAATLYQLMVLLVGGVIVSSEGFFGSGSKLLVYTTFKAFSKYEL